MNAEEEEQQIHIIAARAIEKHRVGDPLTDLEVAAGEQVCTELSWRLMLLGPYYHMVATDIALKAREFERISEARERPAS